MHGSVSDMESIWREVGGLYEDGGSPLEGPVVVPSEVCSKAGWADKVHGKLCRAVRVG